MNLEGPLGEFGIFLYWFLAISRVGILPLSHSHSYPHDYSEGVRYVL